ncbi:nitroreductase family protein [Pontibacter sp. MBLB2868]|uniref:nitroreductase family protein n=1 Tax=Pontibacter sp. MBLB2868 TaxID=3451555 RepID=UPI003F754E29
MPDTDFPFIPYHPDQYTSEEVVRRAQEYFNFLDKRRSVREFSDKPVPRKVIERLLMTASTAPSGAHKQPWTFCVISNPELKQQIRAAAEKEEYDSYHGRMTPEWLEDLAPLGTDWRKPFLEVAPWLIVVFKKAYDFKEDGSKRNNYYVSESVGIACGFLISAIHHAGLVTLTHTPSPMNFLTKLLKRPENERPFLLLPVGYPAHEVRVPDLERKPLQRVSEWYE